MRKDIKKAADAIADLMPGILSGAELEFFAKNNITSSQFVTLIALFYTGCCTMSCLANGLHVSMPTVSGLIERLVKPGLVKRVASTQDRRLVYVELSAKGNSLIDEFKNVVRNRWGKLLNALLPAEVKSFQNILAKIDGYIKEQKRKNEV